MARTVIDVCVPMLVFVAMFVVGMELTIDDFRRVVKQPGTIFTATVGQLVLLPFVGWILVRWLRLQPDMAQGVILVAACPNGAMANVYAYLARGNVTLSVTLTAVSCLAAVIKHPISAQRIAGSGCRFERHLGAARRLGRTISGLACVAGLGGGMGTRRRWPEITRQYGRVLIGLNVGALAVLLGLIIAQESWQFANAMPDIVAAASLLAILAFGLGWVIGWASGAAATDRFTLGIVFVVRNVGIATAIAVTVLGRTEFAVFATAYFLTQVPILLAAVCVFRRLQVGDKHKIAKA